MRFLLQITSLLVALFLSACGGGGGSAGVTPGQSLFTTAPLALTLGVGAAESFTVGGGAAPYTVNSTNSSVAVVALKDKVLTIGGLKVGSAVVTLRDNTGATISITVTVAASETFFTTAPGQLNLALNTTLSYTIGGGVAPYTATSSNISIVRAQVTGNTLSLTGMAVGTALVTLRDSAGSTITISVTVDTGRPLFTTAPSSLTIGFGAANARSFTVGGGVGPYTVSSANTNIATATLSANGTLTITGINTGSTTVQVRDVSGATVSINVAVRAEALGLNPAQFNALVGDVLYSVITGGKGPYTTVSGFPDALDAEVGNVDSAGGFTPDPNGNILRVRVKQVVANGSVVLRDANGNTANLSVTSSVGTVQISLSPSPLTVPESIGSITLTLYGATGATTLFSSDPAIATVPGSVTGSSAGVPIPVTIICNPDGISPTVTITAIDETGALARATLNLVESSSGTCTP